VIELGFDLPRKKERNVTQTSHKIEHENTLIAKITYGMYTPAYTGAQDTCLLHTTLAAKMHIHPRKYARATVQHPLRHAKHCGPSCNLSSAQETARIHDSLWCSCSVLSHRYHLNVCDCAGPIQFVYGSHSPFATEESILYKNSMFNIFAGLRKSSCRSRLTKERKHDPLRCDMFIYTTSCGRVQ